MFPILPKTGSANPINNPDQRIIEYGLNWGIQISIAWIMANAPMDFSMRKILKASGIPTKTGYAMLRSGIPRLRIAIVVIMSAMVSRLTQIPSVREQGSLQHDIRCQQEAAPDKTAKAKHLLCGWCCGCLNVFTAYRSSPSHRTQCRILLVYILCKS